MFIYVNGDSYSRHSDGKTYCDFLSEKFNCESHNAAISGSSNGRILRTSLRDLIDLKKEHTDIIAIISLSFLLRIEVWDPDAPLDQKNTFVNDGDFISIQTTNSANWVKSKISDRGPYQKYTTEWLRLYDVEAETINLLKEILLLTTWCKYNKINYIIFSGPLQEPVDFEFPAIKPFYQSVTEDPYVIDIFKNSFTEWCINRGHSPTDFFTQEIHGKTYNIGHHGENAHKDFANYLFENYLNKYNKE